MNRIRQWAFPAGLILAWIVTTAYTLSVVAATPPAAAAHTSLRS